MTTATHNGTCQICGREVAHSHKHGTIAKHGYTTRFGFFEGVCPGSDEPPLEKDHHVADHHIALLRQQALRDYRRADDIEAGTVEVTHVTFSVYDPEIRKHVERSLTREQWIFAADDLSDYNRQFRARRWDELAARRPEELRQRAAARLSFAKDMEARKAAVFGTELKPRVVDTGPERKTFRDFRGARDFQRKLEAEGIKSRSRRDRYSNAVTVTWRV